MSSTSRPRGRQVNAAQAVGLLVSFVLVATIGGVVAAGLALPAVAAVNTTTNLTVTAFGDLPSELVQKPLPEKSNILASDGTLLATFYAQNRVVVPIADISPQLQHAVVATEDKRFYEHSGVDLQGMTRALVLSVLKPGSQQQGASTITQQYVKNVLIEQALSADTTAEQVAGVQAATEANGSAGYARKLKEAKLALTLEQKESKQQILENYLNIAPFGSSVYGAETAANHYFSVSAKDLTYLQAATIAGITQNPTKWDPVLNPKESEGRRNIVLGLMHDQGYITDAEYTKGIATPLASTLKVSPVKQGCLTAGDAVPGSGYFCDYVTKVIINDPAFGATKADRQALLYKGGLTILTTLDKGQQAIADAEVKRTVPVADPSGVRQAISVVEPGTGQIKAMAQDTIYDVSNKEPGHSPINYNTDRAYGGSQGFQPGSTFKAFTLMEWLKEGHALNDTVDASVASYKINSFKAPCTGLGGGTYKVSNSEGSQSGIMSVIDATRNSVNRAYLAMAHQLNLCSIMQNAADLGVVQNGSGKNFSAVPGNVLGAESTSPLAVAGAYATFASGGTFCKPIAILKVTDTTGKELAVPSADCQQKVDPDVANAVAYAMSKVWTGTAKSVSPKPSFPAAGKTGTSSTNENTWFAGYTPRLAAAVVVGRETPTPVRGPVGTFTKHTYVFGSDIAAPTWARFMTQVLATGDNPGFPTPSDKMLYGVKVYVPYVVGSSVAQATSKLQAAGFQVSVASTPIDSPVPAGLVAQQSATSATAGSTITLTLSTGNSPAATSSGPGGGPGTGPGQGGGPGNGHGNGQGIGGPGNG